MKIRADILNELKTISKVLADVPYLNVYTVDTCYFGGIAAELKARIDADTLYNSQNNFAVPDGYFENLSANIFQRIKAEESEVFAETKEHSALIAGIGNRNLFSAPNNYFEELTFIKQKKPVSKVIEMIRTRAVFKYTAAAVITGLIGFSIINIVNKTNTNLSSEVSVQTAEVMKKADKIIKTGTFDKELENVSDKDIEQYLQQGGQDVHAALVAASTEDADKLPDAADYLVDENALDNYLKENNLKN